MELEREGFIYSVRGRGNFVKGNDTLLEKKQEEMIEELAKLLVEARELGLDQETLIREAVERAGNGGQ
jgi:GntR family transcriptional regulator